MKTLVPAFAALAVLALASPAEALQCHVGTFTFYPEGGIKSCRIEADHQFWTDKGDRLVCSAGHMVTQYPDGELESCTITRAFTFGGETCDGPARVELNPDGSLKGCG
jgi:hypothetical protein